LTYLIWDEAIIKQEIRNADYDTDVERLEATTILLGSHYYCAINNTTIYEELKPLIINESGQSSFIGQFEKVKNGRAALFAVKSQAKGQSVQLRWRKTDKAYATLKAATYRGWMNGPYNFAWYVEVYQEAFNELADLGEPVPE
jgi:hypothetical protein